jgi:transcriptional regulator with XRE-family HTH domain
MPARPTASHANRARGGYPLAPSPTRVAKLEAGLTDPRFDVLVALSRGLGVGLSALIPEDDEEDQTG